MDGTAAAALITVGAGFIYSGLHVLFPALPFPSVGSKAASIVPSNFRETPTAPAPSKATRGSRVLGATLVAGGLLCIGTGAVGATAGTGDEPAEDEIAPDEEPAGEEGRTERAGSSEECPPVPEDKFVEGGYYRRVGNEPRPTQVVDPDHLEDFDPDANWIARDGSPVLNPAVPLPAEIHAIVAAFGSAQNVIDYNACALRPNL